MGKNFRQIWEQASLMQRVILLAVALSCIGAATLLIGWARRPEMNLLYSQLSPQEASRIVEKIRDAGVPYELKDNGTTIYAPTEEVYELRLTMAQQGLPVGSNEGYRILDDQPIGQSPLTQKINHTRAIEGELARSIQTLDGVASARVHIARPEASLFGPEKQASATVVLRLRGGYRLSASNVASVVHLVAGGVQSLAPENVVIVDSRGTLLSGEADNSMARTANSVLDYQSQIEEYLAGKAEDILTAALGPGRASVKVSATIEMTSLEETAQTYSNEKSLVKMETTKSKTPTAGASAGKAEAGGGKVSKDTEEITEYFPPTVSVKRTAGLPGKISALNASALVDLSPLKAPQGQGAAEQQGAPAEMLKLEEVKEIIANAIGLDEARGDKLIVKQAEFVSAAAAPPALPDGGLFSKDFLLEMARRVSLAVLVIGALLTLKVLGGSKKKAHLTRSGEQLQLEGERAGGGNLLLGRTENLDADAMRARISQALQENPEEVKRLFLSWVESEKGAE
ncbi:MAG: flagellar M-ring protein FliF [Phycisphaerae bacterium]|nr:flagellar M-ring protein FliF [Phycisphaerae bacterium]